MAIACLKDPELSDLLKPDIQIVRQYNVHKRLGALKSDTSPICKLLLSSLASDPRKADDASLSAVPTEVINICLFILIRAVSYEARIAGGARDIPLSAAADELRKAFDIDSHPQVTSDLRWWQFVEFLCATENTGELRTPSSFISYQIALRDTVELWSPKLDNTLLSKLRAKLKITVDGSQIKIDQDEVILITTQNLPHSNKLVSNPDIVYFEIPETKKKALNQDENEHSKDEGKSNLLIFDDVEETLVIKEVSERFYQFDHVTYFPSNQHWDSDLFENLENFIANPTRQCSDEEKCKLWLLWLSGQTGLTGEPLIRLATLHRDFESRWELNPNNYTLSRPRFSRQGEKGQPKHKYLLPICEHEYRQVPNFFQLYLEAQTQTEDAQEKLKQHHQNFRLQIIRIANTFNRTHKSIYLFGSQRNGLNEPLAQLLYSSNHEQLSAQTSYYSLSSSGQLAKSLRIVNDESQNILGSQWLLKPEYDVRFLVDVIKNVLQPTRSPVEQFNKQTIAIVILILVVTASRPTLDPFDKRENLSLKNRIIYINDKLVRDRPSGRPVPLLECVTKIIEHKYFKLLIQIAEALNGLNNETSQVLKDLVSPNKSNKQGLPLFFLIDQESNTGWRSISPTDIAQAFGGELPANIFRHNICSNLANKLSQDIIDQVAGHQLFGLHTHGITSTRVLAEDHEKFVKVMTATYQEAIDQIEFPAIDINLLKDSMLNIKPCKPTDFGIDARLEAQKKNEQKAQIYAEVIAKEILKNITGEITRKNFFEFLEQRPDLSADADIQNRAIELCIRILKDKEPTRVRLSSRRTLPPGQKVNPSYLFESIDLQSSILEKIQRYEISGSSRSIKLNRLIAMLRLIFIYGVAQDRIFSALISGNWSLYALQKKAYLSFHNTAEQSGKEHSQEFERIQIDKQTYNLLKEDHPNPQSASALTKHQIQILQEWFNGWIPKLKTCDSLASVIEEVLPYRRAYNTYFFPGMLAAACNGEFFTWSESKDSLVYRQNCQQRLSTPTEPPARVRIKFDRLNLRAKKSDSSINSIDSFLSNWGNKNWESIVLGVESFLSSCVPNSNPYLLALYVKHLLGRENSRSSRKRLGKSTIFRYALSIRKFLSFCGDLNLAECDYWQLIEIRDAHLQQLTKITAKSECQHINEFLTVSLTKVGFYIPPWLALEKSKPRDTIIDEAIYKQLLHSSSKHITDKEHHGEQVKLTFLLAYLYGLRSGEIEVIKHSDFVIQEDFPVIRLKRTGNEALKTVNANRKILPWRILTEEERSLLNRKVRMSTISLDDRLFPRDRWGRIYADGLNLLKNIAPSLDYHCLRDSRISIQIESLFSSREADRLSARALITGKKEGSKQEGYGIANQIGHSQFITTLESYAKGVLQLAVNYAVDHSKALEFEFEIEPDLQISTKTTEPSDEEHSETIKQYPALTDIFYELIHILFLNSTQQNNETNGLDIRTSIKNMHRELALVLPATLNPAACDTDQSHKKKPKPNNTFNSWAINRISNIKPKKFWALVIAFEKISDEKYGLFEYLSNRAVLFCKDNAVDIKKLRLLRIIVHVMFGKEIAKRLQFTLGRFGNIENFDLTSKVYKNAHANFLTVSRLKNPKRDNDASTANFLTRGLNTAHYLLKLEKSSPEDQIHFDKTSLLVTMYFLNFCLMTVRSNKFKAS